MAGNYPDPPGPRLAWDADGSQLVRVISGVATTLSAANAKALNDEDDAGHVAQNNVLNYYVIIFPELRDLAGYFIGWVLANATWGSFNGMWTSPDSTNGVDGTWNTVVGATATAQGTAVKPAYRTSIQAKAVTGVKAVRFAFTESNAFGLTVKALHLYGVPSTAVGNRLELWHATLDQRLGAADLDWGNAPQGTVDTRQFRVKNSSATLTATGVAVSLEANNDATPTQVSQHTLSAEGSTFTASLSLGNLAPGGLSGVLHLRRTELVTAGLGVWSLRVKAAPVSWN